LYSKRKRRVLPKVKGKIYKDKLYSGYCKNPMEMNSMKWNPIFAVLLGLLTTGMTAGGAMALSWQANSEKACKSPYEPASGGLTAQITTIVKVNGQPLLHPQQFENHRWYSVPKGSKGSFMISVIRVPIGTYHVKIATNKEFKIYPSMVRSLDDEEWEYQGVRYNAGYPFYEFSTPHHGWWSSSSFEVPVEFNEITGVLVYGYIGADPVEAAIATLGASILSRILAVEAGMSSAVSALGALLGAVAATEFSIDAFFVLPAG